MATKLHGDAMLVKVERDMLGFQQSSSGPKPLATSLAGLEAAANGFRQKALAVVQERQYARQVQAAISGGDGGAPQAIQWY